MRDDMQEPIRTVRVVIEQPGPKIIRVPVVVREETIRREVHFVRVKRKANNE
jgi:hypothetical protein